MRKPGHPGRFIGGPQQNPLPSVLADVNGPTSPVPRLDEMPGTRMAGVMAAYDDNQRDLFSYLLATVRDRQAAEDILQEAFLKLVREARSGRAPENPRAWLFRVAANLAASRGRRLGIAGRTQGADGCNPSTPPLPNPAISTTSRVANSTSRSVPSRSTPDVPSSWPRMASMDRRLPT